MINCLFRCDYSNEIGYGHVIRSLALAKNLSKKYNWNIIFAIKIYSSKRDFDIPKEFLIFEFNKKEKINEELWLNNIIKKSKAHCIVFDIRNNLSSNYLKKVKKKDIKVFCIDDPSDRRLSADINFYPPSPRFYKLNWEKFKGKNFIGYEYTILRNIFYQQKNFLFKKKENKPKKIVICMGGSDPNNITLKLLEIINKYAQDEIFFDIVVGPGYKPKEELNLYLKEFKYNFKLHQSLSEKRMVDLLNVCNLAIITFGVTAYELAALAVPSIHICLDKDHFEASNVFQENGIANSFKVYKLSKLNIVVKYFFYLLNNENLINKMNKKAKLISNKIKECRVAIVLFEIMKNV